jgi:hypothetical protein
MKRKTSEDYDRFVAAMDRIVRVPHAEIKAQLDAEKAAKEKKKASRLR